ncbi:reverse transcriptase domain-containing protein [Tanacetum coccineum]
METQYGKFLDMIRAIRINVPLVDVLAGMPNYGKFLKEFISNKHKIEQISSVFLSDESSAMIQNKVPPKLGDPGSFLIPCNFNKTFSCNALADLGANINLMPYSLYAKLSLEILKPTKMSIRLTGRSFQYPVGIAKNMLVEVVIRVKQKQLNLGVRTERMIFIVDSAMKHSYSNDDTCFSIDVIDEILEEDFDALLDEGSKILHSIEGTFLEEEIFSEFDEFMAMIADEHYGSESDIEEPPFEEITINTNYKIKTSLEVPLTDLKLKPLPDNLEYVFLKEPSFLLVIISSRLSAQNKSKLVSVLKKHKQAFAWKTTDIPGICPSFCKHKIQLLDNKKQVIQKQRRLNPNMQEVVKNEIVKLLDTGIIYPITDSPWVSPIHCVPKKGGITVVTNENYELVPTRTVTGLRVCIDYHKLKEATAKDHFPLPFMGKCHFMVKEGIMIGHKVSSTGLEVDKAKIDVISKLPPSTNIKGIRSFLGHVGLYRRFIKDFSKIARPLTKLLEKDTQFEFVDECQRALELLKEKLTCAPVIVSPNWSLPFELMCDASDFVVGAVLGQKDGKNFHPIYLASKILNPAQQKYTVTEKELMAVVFAFDKFRSYLILSKTIVHTDRSALKHLFKKQDAKPHLICWTLLLQEFDIEIKDRKDFANYLVADIIPKEMTYQQKSKFFSLTQTLTFWEDLTLKLCSDGMIRRCVFGPETRTILDKCHHRPTGGHYRPNITAKKVLDLGFYWPTIIKEAHTLVRLCEACQKTGNISKSDEMPLNNIQVCEIFNIWGIDFMGPFLKSHKFEYILVIVDYVSKWAKAQSLPTNDARVIITFLKNLFCRFEMPKALISDRGTQFCNKIMEKTMKRYGVNHRFSTSYHPQTSGQVENTNIALKRILEKTVKNNPAIWSRKLDDALWAFLTAYKTPTGTTPYKLIYGKNCHLPFEIEHRVYWALKNYNPDLIAAGEKRMFQLHELDELRHQAYENSRLYKARTKVWHDRKLRMRKEFKHENKVLLFHSKYKFKQPKLRSRWLGPYVVKHQYPSGYVELYGKDVNTFIVNGYRLKLYHEEEDYNDQREAVTPFFPKE